LTGAAFFAGAALAAGFFAAAFLVAMDFYPLSGRDQSATPFRRQPAHPSHRAAYITGALHRIRYTDPPCKADPPA
jgi:hypothetical protein